MFHARRASVLLSALVSCGLSPKRLRWVHPSPERPAGLFLLEALKGGGEGLTVEPPLFVRDERGDYTPELLRAYEIGGL